MNLADELEYFSRTSKHWRDLDIVAFNHQQRAELTRITAFNLGKRRVEHLKREGWLIVAAFLTYDCGLFLP